MESLLKKWSSFIMVSVLSSAVFVLTACESSNDHFCAKYSFYYKRMTEPGVLSHADMETMLREDLNKDPKTAEQARIALFVLNDLRTGRIPQGADAKAFCITTERWSRY